MVLMKLEMSYGKYIAYGLPDKVIFSFNTKDYKLPKELHLIMMMELKKSQMRVLKIKKESGDHIH
jgi:hypothetical protein